MQVKQAVIPVAGYGTRWMPYTKAIEKCMLPVMDRPLVDWLVEDAVKAGVEKIIFVVGHDADQIRTYYGSNPRLEQYLEERGKTDALELARGTSRGVHIEFVVQDIAEHGYGTAIPAYLASGHIDDGLTAIVMGDEFIFNPDGSSEIAKALQTLEKSGAAAALMTTEVDRQSVESYGVIDYEQRGDSKIFKGIVERPTIEEAPSNMINISKYIVPKAFFEHTKTVVDRGPDPELGEFLITEVMNDFLAAGNEVAIHQIEGEYLDGGTPEKWLKTVNRVNEVLNG